MGNTVQIKVWGIDGESCEVTAKRGASLRETLLDAELTPYKGYFQTMNCHGLGLCGSCTVKVKENGEWWERRSCQIPCFRDLEIQLQ